METHARLATALADRYRLERELGQGGMATVYLAEDLKHDRKVAIKVLHPELSAVLGAERFLSEIKTTANLQHPHILGLIDSGEADGLLYYVMPFVDGETLRTRLVREQQLPVKEAVRIATEAASALEYAHKRGIIHRDIKPENILLQDGQVLVADFGIALAVSQAGGQRMTQTGLSLGTPAYMSPEQATGEKSITARSDVYALGAMTYEMLTGDPPFTGSTVQAIIAKAMTEKPIPPSRIRDTVPAPVEHAVLTALQKLPADRFASAREFAEALASEVASSRAATLALPSVRGGGGPWRRVSAALGVATLAALALAGWALGRRPAATGPAVYDAALPDSAPMAYGATASRTGYGLAMRNLSVAPSGDFAVYAAREGESSALWVRSLRDGTARRIEGTDGAQAPRVSPDGRLVAFYTGNQVGVVPLAGGAPRLLLEVQGPMWLDWLSSSSLVAGTEDGYRMTWLDPEAGPVKSERIARCGFGRWDPVSRRLMCRINTAAAVDPESGRTWPVRTTLPDGSEGPALAGSGLRIIGGDLLMYISAEGELRVAPYDAASSRIGRPATLWKGIRAEALGDAQFDVTADGTLVFAPGVNAEIGRIVRLKPGGTPEPFVADAAPFQRFDLSPDRRWLAAVVQAPEGQELRLYDMLNGQRSVLARSEYIRHPLWSPSSDRLLTFARDGGRAAVLGLEPGSGRAADSLLAGDTATVRLDVIDWPSEHEVVAQDWGSLLSYRMDPAAPRRLDTLLTDARFVSVAPGGRLLSYQIVQGSALSVTTHPVPGRRWQVAPDGAEPLWLSAGELLYRLGASWFVVQVDPATGEPRGAPKPWARDPRFSDTGGWSHRLDHEGGIIYVQGPEETSGAYLRVIPGWVAQARRAVAEVNR